MEAISIWDSIRRWHTPHLRGATCSSSIGPAWHVLISDRDHCVGFLGRVGVNTANGGGMEKPSRIELIERADRRSRQRKY